MAETVKRVRRTPDETRRLTLDAAQSAIARTGPEGLRLHDIAAAAGISHPLIRTISVAEPAWCAR